MLFRPKSLSGVISIMPSLSTRSTVTYMNTLGLNVYRLLALDKLTPRGILNLNEEDPEAMLFDLGNDIRISKALLKDSDFGMSKLNALTFNISVSFIKEFSKKILGLVATDSEDLELSMDIGGLYREMLSKTHIRNDFISIRFLYENVIEANIINVGSVSEKIQFFLPGRGDILRAHSRKLMSNIMYSDFIVVNAIAYFINKAACKHVIDTGKDIATHNLRLIQEKGKRVVDLSSRSLSGCLGPYVTLEDSANYSLCKTIMDTAPVSIRIKNYNKDRHDIPSLVDGLVYVLNSYNNTRLLEGNGSDRSSLYFEKMAQNLLLFDICEED